MNKKGNMLYIGIAVVILVAGYLILNNIYVSYDTHTLNPIQRGYYCSNGEIKLPEDSTEWAKMMTTCEFSCSSNMENYLLKKSPKSYCDKDNNLICECRTSIYNVYIAPLFRR